MKPTRLPPIFVVFFFGVFWKRLNAQGCFWAMVVGFIVGMFRMAVDTPITLGLFKSYPEGSLFWIVNNINFQYFSILITVISINLMGDGLRDALDPKMRRS